MVSQEFSHMLCNLILLRIKGIQKRVHSIRVRKRRLRAAHSPAAREWEPAPRWDHVNSGHHPPQTPAGGIICHPAVKCMGAGVRLPGCTSWLYHLSCDVRQVIQAPEPSQPVCKIQVKTLSTLKRCGED